MPVQRGAADTEDLGDLGLRHPAVAHLLRLPDLVRRHLPGPAPDPAPDPAAGTGRGEADLGAFADEVALDYLDNADGVGVLPEHCPETLVLRRSTLLVEMSKHG